MTADYHREGGNRQFVLGRCYELTAQVRQQSDAVAMGNTSAHLLHKRQLADKDNESRRLLRILRVTPAVSEFQSRSPFLVVAATDELNAFTWLARRSVKLAWHFRRPKDSDDGTESDPLRRTRRTAVANCGAIQQLLHAGESDSDSEVLGEAAVVPPTSGRDHPVAADPTAPPSVSAPPPTSSPATPKSLTQALKSLVVDLASVTSPVSSSALTEDLKRRFIGCRDPGNSDFNGGNSPGGGSVATSPNVSNKLAESSDGSGDDSTLADTSNPGSQLGSSTGPNSQSLPPGLPTAATQTPTPALASRGDKTLSLRSLSSMVLRYWEKILGSCVVSVIMEKTADCERVRSTPDNIAGIAAFMDVDDPGHPLRLILRLLPHSHIVVDDSVLDVCSLVEKGKRSKKLGSLLKVLSHEWCNRIDYEFTALWKSLMDYLLSRKQRSDLLRLAVKVFGDAVVGAANHTIHGQPAPLDETEVCFDPTIPFSPPVNLPWFPRTAD
ncbi:unnamed protein product [Phytophthora fragariaefolia]|uniref:Unnamed protein product n=1 Tax=Phytophthora fragariaefolia TaxID=1490495 RepID=A0A9W6Y3E1_9STRA|nr:unnamed protein product [Phytophthora fragariaefolia]